MHADHAAPLRYASGFIDITPAMPLVLAGYAGRAAPYAGIADRLEANAAVVQDRGATLVLISFDLLYVGDLLRTGLEQALRAHIEPTGLLLAASHTHFGPATDPTLPNLGTVDHAYVALVVDRVANLVLELLRGPFEPLTVGVGHTTANHAVNRRCAGWRIGRRFPFLRKSVWMQPNPAGPKDESIGVIRLGTRAVIWNYACHPVFVPWMNHVSADYIGQVRTVLRQQFGHDLTVLFWQGFSGDIYPSFASTMFKPVARAKRLLFRTSDAVDPLIWQAWCNSLATTVANGVRSVARIDASGPIQSVRKEIALRELLGSNAPEKRISVHHLRIGAGMEVFAISAEMVSAHRAAVRERFCNERLFCVGCIDGVFGYLPSSRMVSEGGYEAEGFLPYFSLRGKFPEDIEAWLQDRLPE